MQKPLFWIVGIVWQATKAVFTRLLEEVDPSLIEEIRHAARHMPEVQEVTQVRSRWLGHRLHAELHIAVSPHLSVAEGHGITTEVRHHLFHHVQGNGHVDRCTGKTGRM